MKKTLSFMVMALALLLTQCRKPEVKFPSPVAPEGTTVSMTVTAGPGSKTDITTAGAITWSSGDKLYVGFNGEYVGYLTLTSGQNTPTGWFSGNVTLPTDTENGEKTFHFFYLGSNPPAVTSGTSSVEVSFAEQEIYADANNKLVNASKHHVGYGTAKGTVAGSEVTGINVTLVSKVALACFSFTDGTTPYSGALMLSGDHIYNSMTVGFGGTFSGTKTGGGEISLTDATLSEKYVMLVPAGATGDVALSFGGGGKTGGATIEGGIQSNKFYGKTDAIAVNLTTPEYVDLGLPSGRLWATCNLGAEHPYDYGDYYAWGATETWYSAGGQTSSPTWKDGYSDGYTWAHCPGNGGNSSYNATEIAAWDNSNLTNSVLKPEVDAAHANLGEPWCMPTEADFQELKDNTTRTWYDEGNTEFNGVAGWKCANKSDATKYIFLPLAGMRKGTGYGSLGSKCYYWSSSRPSDYPHNGRELSLTESVFDVKNNGRQNGFSVRPVRPSL